MNHLPTIDLLESTHTFPGRYVLKVIGKTEDGFVSRVVAAVREQMESEIDPPYRMRSTRGGRHVSVTIEPFFESAWDVIAVYGRIQDIVGVVLLM